MSMQATIVEQLQELRRMQLQQQQELIRQQQEQRELLTSEHNRLYEVLSLSVDEMDLHSDSLQEIVKDQKTNENLIDLDTPDDEIDYKTPKRSHSFAQYAALNGENHSGSSLHLKVPKLQLGVKNTRSDSRQNVQGNNSYGQHDYSSELSILDSTQSYSLDKSQREGVPIDDTPVPSPHKDFITLLEEKLKDSTEEVAESKRKPVVTKPFLKKGEGLVRYMPNTNSNKTSKSTRTRSASLSSGTHTNNNNARQATKTNLGRCNSLPRSRKSDILRKPVSPAPVAQQKLNLKNIAPPKSKPRSKSVGFVPSPSEKKKFSETVSDSNTSDLEVKSKKEQEEIRIFELLEDKAENSSFCSTSSTIIAFMQQSTPLKQKALLHSASKHKISLSDIGDETLDELVKATKLNYQALPPQKSTKDKTPAIPWDEVPISTLKNNNTAPGVALPYGTDMDEKYDDDASNKEMDEDENNVSLHVRFAEYNEYKTMTDTSSISSDSHVNVNYVNEKGAWSDCSVNTDSSDIDNVVLLQLKQKLQTNNLLETPRGVHNAQYDTDEDATEDFKHDAVGDDDDEEEDDETGSKDETLQKEETTVNGKNVSHSIFRSELLKTRLQELEREIEIFRKESAALTIQRQKLQEERTKLQEERISIQRTYEDKAKALEIEKKRTENHLQEEKKRLTREKTALENRMKDAWEKAQKSKQERQEIEKLREQLEELKEEISQKESKWSATNARQRSQMRVLQTENSKLKQELEKLQQKKNAKLKKPPANTRAIHQINKFLADRKKISPFKNENDYNEEAVKAPETVDAMYDDLDLEPVELEEMPMEDKTEKVKVLKSTESIVRTRNLYESLLRDATGCLGENHVERRNLLNQHREQKSQEVSNHSDEEEHDYHEEHVEEIRTSPNRKSSKSPQKIQQESDKYNDHGNNNVENPKSTSNKQGIREVHHPDGRVEYWYPNGNVKKIFPDKCLTKMIYYNGDVRETDKNGTVKYFYASTRTWHTTMPDGLEILEFPDGQVERRSKDGTIEVTFPDGSVRIVQVDGSEKWVLRDGTIAETSSDGEKILTLPNGQREIHTKDHKRREYPDGTVKLVYADGIQETRYANGRIRLKDKDGNLIMDTHQ